MLYRLFISIQFFLLFLSFGSVFSMFNSTLIDFVILIINFILLSLLNVFFKKKHLIMIISIILILILHSFLSSSKLFQYFGLFFRILNIYFLCSFLNFETIKIKKYFVKALWIIAYLSLLNLILINLIPNYFETFENKDGFSVSSLMYLFNYNSTISIYNFNIFRNQGMFWEPGVLQIPLLFLFYHLIIEKKEYLKSLLILVLIFSTFSTTGIIGVLLIVFYEIILKFKENKNKLGLFIKSISIFILIIPIFIFSLNHKLNDEKDNISSIARTYDLLIGIKMVAKFPFFGLGIEDDKYLKEIRKESVSIFDERLDDVRGNTNALLTYFIKFGIPIAVIILYLFYNQNLFNNKFAFFTILILVLSASPLVFVNIWFLLILTSFFKNRQNDIY